MNMWPQTITRLGFGYERLRAVNPRLVYCAAYGYGQDGPLADRPAFDDIIQGASGFVALSVATTGEACFVPTLVGDKTVGRDALRSRPRQRDFLPIVAQVRRTLTPRLAISTY